MILVVELVAAITSTLQQHNSSSLGHSWWVGGRGGRCVGGVGGEGELEKE